PICKFQSAERQAGMATAWRARQLLSNWVVPALNSSRRARRGHHPRGDARLHAGRGMGVEVLLPMLKAKQSGFEILGRSFGGQSVVPWELALFLIEEMKAEGLRPSAGIYTAAIAECEWGGEKKHVEHLLGEVEEEGLNIVSVAGVSPVPLPPSQEGPRVPGALAANAALATVEALWAGGVVEPTPLTCLAALETCAVGGQWERALSLVRDAVGAEAGAGQGVGAGTR
ncbi:unnamed protein product, partial [Discosporangium mesarthrocarpum]